MFNLQTIKRIFQPKKQDRKPAEGGHIVTLSGAVMIHTHDGNNVVLTPAFARQVASVLTQAANEAEAHMAAVGLSG